MNKVHISEKMLKFHEMITLRIILTTVKINIKTLSLSYLPSVPLSVPLTLSLSLCPHPPFLDRKSVV